MSLLEEIRQQPKHIRQIMFGLCVTITISMIGIIWYRSFEKNIFALLNPTEMQNQSQYAQNNSGLLSDIGGIFSGLGASIKDMIGISKEINTSTNVDTTTDSNKPYLLPLSETKK
jgi:hypothetical protein